MSSSRKVIAYYWKYIKRYPKSGIALLVFYVLGGVVSNVLGALISKGIVDAASAGAESEEAVRKFFFWIWVLGGQILLYNIFYRLADYFSVFFESNVLRDIADDVFDRLHNHSYGFFADNFTGSLVSKTKRFIGSFSSLFGNFVWQIVFRIAQVAGLLILLIWHIPVIGFAYLLWIVLFIGLSVWFSRIKMPYDLREANMDSTTIARYADTVTNAVTIKLFSGKWREFSSYQKITDRWERARRKARRMNNLLVAAQGIMFAILEFGVMTFVGMLWSRGEITVGTIVLVQLCIIGTFDTVWGFGRALLDMEKALSDAQEMVAIFEQDILVKDPENPEKCRIQKGEIVFENVSFVYEQNNQKVLDGFSLRIAPGEKIGIVGHSGAGKTTVTKILLRFADISGGSVKIDGQEIRLIAQDDLRRNISYVPQDPVLFHRSLKENIGYGRPGSTQEEIFEAARRAHAQEFIEKLPKQYNTLVGERGIKLSGGERQRVAIARAMLKNAPILILDEATSSLDSLSEQYIQESLDELMKNRTTIVIAHRLSTIQKMDRILVIENGTIVEEGNHRELIDKNGIYAEFWKQQAGGFIGE